MTIMQTKSDGEVRAAVKQIFGAENARVAKNGEVHVRGLKPNTSTRGWYLLGFTGQTELDESVWHPDGSLNMSLYP